MSDTTVVILAAGKGTRMKSDLPKVLHRVNGVTLINNILNQSKALGEQLVVVGYAKEDVIKEIPNNVKTVVQAKQLGTGDALKCALSEIDVEKTNFVMVLPGDHPFIVEKFLLSFMAEHKEKDVFVSMGTVKIPNYEGEFREFYNCGRVIRDEKGEVKEIVELKDASEEQKKFTELNTSYYVFNAKWLKNTITKIENSNASNEYYLTDIVALARKEGKKVHACVLPDHRFGLGVNTKEQLDAANDISKEM